MPEPVSRYNVVFSIPVAPGCCFLCRSANPANGPYVDTQKDLQWEREAVFICAACVMDMYNRLTTETVSQAVLEDIEPLPMGIVTDQVLSAVEAAFDGLRSDLLGRARLIDTGDLFPDGVVDPAPVATSNGGEVQGGISASGPVGQVSNANSKRRSNDVPSDPSDQDLGLDL